jgi:hypothetical protein
MLSGQSDGTANPHLDGCPDTVGGHSAGSIEAPEPVYLTIEEAVSEGILTGVPESVKRTLRRDIQLGKPAAPEVHLIDGARRYAREELAAWRDSRPRVAGGPDADLGEAGEL